MNEGTQGLRRHFYNKVFCCNVSQTWGQGSAYKFSEILQDWKKCFQTLKKTDSKLGSVASQTIY